MAIGVRLWLSRLLDAGEAKTAFGRALLRERYRALQRQIPLLYAIVLINFLGLHFASGEPTVALFQPITLLVLFIVVRLVHWVRMRSRTLAPERILRELRRTLILAALLSTAFGYSAIHLYGQLPGSRAAPRHPLRLAGRGRLRLWLDQLSGRGAACPCFSSPCPSPACLAASGNAAHAGVGISLGLITLMILRLVNLHNRKLRPARLVALGGRE